MRKERFVALEPADLVIAYTDGVVEATNQDGEEWGAGLIEAAVCGAQGCPNADDLVTSIFHSMDDFSQEHQTDDATLAVVQVIGLDLPRLKP